MLSFELVIFKSRINFDFTKVLFLFSKINRWAYILHDKNGTNAHYHLYIEIDSDECSCIYDLFKTQIEFCFEDWLPYALHDVSQGFKYQYSLDDIESNFYIKSYLENEKGVLK